MGVLSLPAKIIFDDFSFDCSEYIVKRNSSTVGSYSGFTNKDESGKHIAFLIESDIKVGDVLSSFNESYVINFIEYDSYNGKLEMLRAYY